MSSISTIDQIVTPDSWKLTPATLASKLSNGLWIASRHLRYISALIAVGIAKGNARIIVTMPPRHGKSELISVYTPIWALDWDPTMEIILTSYGAELAEEFGQKARDIILDCQDPDSPHDLRVKIRKGSSRVDRFLTTEGGGMRSKGLMGTITGRGADLLLVDDFLKNPKDAASETIKNDQFDWFRSVARTRLHKDASIIILAQRLDENDLVGMLLRNQPGRWKCISLPAIAEKDDPLGREIGEALWPEMFPKKELDSLKDDLGDYFWAAQYQQRPKPRTETQVDRNQFHIIEELPQGIKLRLCRAWDLASTPGGGDYTSSTLMGVDDKTHRIYVLDNTADQFGAAKVERLVKGKAVEDTADVPIYIEQEPGSSGVAVIDNYVDKVLRGFATEGQRATGDKFVRAQPFFAQIQCGNVYLLRGPWNTAFMDELESFPGGDHDDKVDSASLAFNKLNSKIYRGVTWGRKTSYTTERNVITGVTFGR